MFLNLLRRRAADESGSSILAVVGMVAVAGLLTTVVTMSTISALGYTSSTRAGVQAQAAADAGVEFAVAAIRSNHCTSTLDKTYADVYSAAELSTLGVSGSDPFFETTVQYKAILSGTWTTGCPTGLLSALLNWQVRIESTGYAASGGVNGVSALDTHTVEAVYGWSIVAPPPDTSIQPTGPAVYAYSSSGFGGGGTLYAVDGSSPNVMIKTGNVACSGGSAGIQDLVVDGGTLTLSGSCNITGNTWSTGRTTLDGGMTIGGNVVAAGVTHKGTLISGSVWSSLDVSITGGGKIQGTAVGATLTLTNGRLVGGGWIYGKSTLDWGGYLDGNLTTRSIAKPTNASYDSGYVHGTITVKSGGVGETTYSTAPVRPFVPNWIDFAYDHSDWTGFTAVSMSGACPSSELQTKVNGLAGQPGVIDARNCTSGIVINGSTKIALGSDVAIIANRVSLTNGGGFTSTADRRLWLITPDPPGLLTTGTPTCPLGGSFTLSGDFDFSSTISTMIYTPCAVAVGTGIDTFRGQLFVGRATIDGGAHLGYDAIGLPGVDLFTGESTDGGILGPILTLGSIGELDYYRDLADPTVG